MIDKQQFDLIADYAEQLRTKQVNSKLNKRSRRITLANAKNYRLFTYMVCLLGYNKPANVLTSPQQWGSTFYRGALSLDHHAQLLCDYDYHYGSGGYGNGIYATTNKNSALNYTDNYKNEHNVIHFKVSPDAKFLPYSIATSLANDLCFRKFSHCEQVKELAEMIDSIDSKKTRSAIKLALLNDPTKLAMMLGYDGISMLDDGTHHTTLIIANRSAINIDKQEFDRITNASKTYKGGVIDFDLKEDEEFLRE